MIRQSPDAELQLSLNFRFPEALRDGSAKRITGEVAERLQEVVEQEISRLGLNAIYDSTHFLHLGTEIIPDASRCSRCGTWTIPKSAWHETSVVSQGFVNGDEILCDMCWSVAVEDDPSDQTEA